MPRPVSIHWLRENAAARSPWRILTVDTETIPPDPARPDDMTLARWCARLDRRNGIDPKHPRTERWRGLTAAELANLVDGISRADRTLWLYCHNLGFDLAVTALPVEMIARGWRLTDGALTTDSPWCRMARGSHRLTMADSWSWLPTSVEQLAPLVGGVKMPLPAVDAPEAEWWARCESDVDIQADAILEVMDWWDQHELGNWSVTGPSCGWGTFRHQRPAPKVLIDPNPDARTAEARAITGGRRDVRRTGELPRALYVDLDLERAHLTAAAELPLPMRRLQPFDSLPIDARELNGRVIDVLAECELDVATPRYAWDSGHGILYPTGRFTTSLTGPEIRAARERGELVSIGRGWRYMLGPVMRQWAQWLASVLDAPTGSLPETVRVMAKGWSRSVTGKWAGHSSEVVDRTPDPRPGWAVIHGARMPGLRPVDLFRVGGQLLTVDRDLWADDAFPAILAFIQAHTRLALGRLLDDLGGAWVAANTDGALVDAWRLVRDQPGLGLYSRFVPRRTVAALAAWCEAWSAANRPFVVRPKGAWTEATVYGPQHLILGDERRLAGIPRKAKEVEPHVYAFEAWPSLRVQLGRDAGPGYQLQQRRVTVDKVPPTGWLDDQGAVVPFHLVTVDGRAEPIGPWSSGMAADRHPADPERQHRIARPLARHLLQGEPFPAPPGSTRTAAVPQGAVNAQRQRRAPRPAGPAASAASRSWPPSDPPLMR